MIKEIIENNDYRLLIEQAEELGNRLGIARVTTVTEIYKAIINSTQRNKDDDTFNFLHLIRPKIALITAKTFPRERPLIDRLYNEIQDAIYLITSTEEKEIRRDRYNTFKDYVEAVATYAIYAANSGARYSTEPAENLLQKKVLDLTLRLNKLLQFVNMAADKAKVFLSHSSKDKKFVEKLKEDLENKGIDTWYDNKDLDIGDIVSDAIAEGIQQSWFFLIVISPNSVNSKWVKYELDEAYDQHINSGKKVLPIVIGDLKHEDVPQRLKKHLYADFREDYGSAFEKVYRSIIRATAKGIENE